MIKPRLSFWSGLLIIGLWLLDRWLKQQVIKSEAVEQEGFFYFVFSLNKQAIFNLPVAPWLILVLSLLALTLVVGLAVYSWRRGLIKGFLGADFLLIGGLSNLYDRLEVGGVIDTFSLADSLYFNLADIYLLIGLILIVSVNWRKTASRRITNLL
ncbi:MAG: signal peptidase II [Candidatus Kerfeldbacteria bacterium]|nr:signal peptidase II [Candidatus Kerfeldbacteria bacterium]